MRRDICRELGGCDDRKPCRVCGNLSSTSLCDICSAEIDEDRRVDAHMDERRGA